jgi:hypothetical protein
MAHSLPAPCSAACLDIFAAVGERKNMAGEMLHLDRLWIARGGSRYRD